jgi:hypothetical protein
MDQQIIVVELVTCSNDGTGDVMVAGTKKITSKTQLEIGIWLLLRMSRILSPSPILHAKS